MAVFHVRLHRSDGCCTLKLKQVWDQNVSFPRRPHYREIVWIPKGSPGTHTLTVHHELGGGVGEHLPCRSTAESEAVVLGISDLWATGSSVLLKLNLQSPARWLRCTDKNFLSRGQKIDKGLYLTPRAKVWLAAFLPRGGRTVRWSWPLNNWRESTAECEMLLHGFLHGAHTMHLPVA